MKAPALKIRILGCGPAWGVPLLAFGWGRCDPNNPKNKRFRSSILVESSTTRILIDASPDLRAQFLAASLHWVDAVLLTHEHADHTRGLDELGILNRFHKKLLPIYASAETLAHVYQSIEYTFKADNAHYAPFFTANTFTEEPFMIGDIPIQPFVQNHGFSTSWGFRMGDFAYSTDVVEMPEASFDKLKGIKLWIVDCLKRSFHPTHSHLNQTLGWIDRVQPDRAILTHMSPSLDYEELKSDLPPGVEPAYDGLETRV